MLKINRSLSVICLAFVTLFPAGCGRAKSTTEVDTKNSSTVNSSSLSGKLTLTGSSTVAPLATELAKQFESRYPGVRIDVQSGGSGKGISDARTGIADIGMASRALKDGERDLIAHQIAADGVCLIVHSSNPVTEI